MRTSTTRRHVRQSTMIHRHHADGVTLFRYEIGQRRGDDCAEARFRNTLLRKRHRCTGVEHEHHRQIGRLAKLSCVQSVTAREQLPVEILEIITGAIRPMLSELGAVTLKRTAMSTGAQSFHDQTRRKFKIIDGGDDGRRERRHLKR